MARRPHRACLSAATRTGASAAALLLCLYAPAGAGAAGSAVEILAGLEAQTLVRHPRADTFHLVQQRNTFRSRLVWDLGRRGAAFGLGDARLTLAHRLTYDSVYDVVPTFREHDLRGRKPGRLGTRDLGDLADAARDAVKLEHQLREAYVDLRPARSPLRLRVGKQQIVWGEADFARILDRANPLDLSWHGAQEIPPPAFGWDELRIPLWMLRLWWEVGRLGPLADVALEAYWNPGDWRPLRISYLPRPWGIRLQHPLTNREDGAFHAPFTGIVRLAYGTSLFRQGRYRRHPGENSQLGLRLSAAMGEVRASLLFFRQRWSGDDGTPVAPVRGIADTAAGRIETQRLIAHGSLPAEYVAPYVHTIGAAASWFDAAWTSATYRLETALDLGLPLFDRARATTLSPLLPGTTDRDYWKAVFAADRGFALMPAGADTLLFVTVQALVHHLIGSTRTLTGPLDLPTVGRRGRPYCGAPPPEPCPDPDGNGSFRDDVRPWEMLLTLAAVAFLRGGTVVPVAGVALDPVNSYAANVFWSVDLAWSPRVSVNLAQRFFISAQDDGQKGPFDPWHVGTQRGRSETGLRITYAF